MSETTNTENSSFTLFGDLSDSGYSFKTLWQEITKSVSAVANACVDGAKLYYQYGLGRQSQNHDWNIEVTKSQTTNYGMIVILAILIILGLGTVVFLKNKN